MLKTRVLTAVVLLAVLLPVMFSSSIEAIAVLGAVFFTAACWESCRLFGYRFISFLTVFTLLLIISFCLLLYYLGSPSELWFVVWGGGLFICILGSLVWIALFIPSLKFGLPERKGMSNLFFGTAYFVSIIAFFVAASFFLIWGTTPPSFLFSPWLLFSVMAIVWVADIGAYFIGKAFGKHPLAPVISPKKSWEGAMGGWFCVLVLGVIGVQSSFFSNNFFVHIQEKWGWAGLFLALTLLTAVSVTGDLVESQLKRRAQMKDSSRLLPGHGGVLDRIDALIPVLPIAMLMELATQFSN